MESARILIVEDERIIALDLKEHLTRFGCEVVGICADAESAFGLVGKTPVDLVLMDIMIQGPTDGIEAAKVIRETSHVPVIFLTAYSDDATLERAKDANPHGYVLKPFKERVLYSAVDIALHKSNVDQQLFEHQALLDSILESIDDAVVSLSADFRVRFANPAAQRLTGLSADEISGSSFYDVCHLFDEQTEEPVRLVDAGRIETRVIESVYLQRQHGTRVTVEGTVTPVFRRSGEHDGYTIALRDVSDVRRMTASLSYQTTHDSLTGLLNRDEFINRMARAIGESSLNPGGVDGYSFLYLYADLDNFKVVNDVSGHAAGDELLRLIADDVNSEFEEEIMAARVGDDEFGLFLGAVSPEMVQASADRFHKLLCRTFDFRGQRFSITASVAAVPIQNDNADPFRVLAAADDACYMTKEQGGNAVRLYERSEYSFRKRRDDMQWASTLNDALDQERLTLFAQPIVHLKSGVNRKKEILLRLTEPDGQIVSPGRFIPAAEQYNLMPEIDRYVLRKTCEHLSGPGRDDPAVFCVNLSGTSLVGKGFFDFIRNLLDEFAIPGERLTFEITETSAIRNFDVTVDLMTKLRDIGSTFALDDFGNGFSSFAYLKKLPVDFLKIDGSFVQHIMNNESDRAMVDAINGIGHVLGMETIAEFVTSRDMRSELLNLGVDYAQGYEIAMPAPLSGERVGV